MHNTPLSFDDNTPLPYVTGMRPQTALFLTGLALYVGPASAADYDGFCSLEVPGKRTQLKGCTVKHQQATTFDGGTTYRVRMDGMTGDFVIRVSKVGACTITGTMPCLFQPATDGNLAVIEGSGARLEFPAPPSAE